MINLLIWQVGINWYCTLPQMHLCMEKVFEALGTREVLKIKSHVSGRINDMGYWSQFQCKWWYHIAVLSQV